VIFIYPIQPLVESDDGYGTPPLQRLAGPCAGGPHKNGAAACRSGKFDLGGGPLSVRDILKETGRTIKINRVTIYRILSHFKKMGIIREIQSGQGSGFYEMACLHNPIHPHFNCRKCGVILCMPPLTLSQAWDWFARPYNFSIESVNVHITGTCNRCREDNNRNLVASDTEDTSL